MFSFFTADAQFYFSLITVAILISAYIIIKKLFTSYKQQKDSIKKALKNTQESLSLNTNFNAKINTNSSNLKEYIKEDALIKNPITEQTKESLQSLNTINDIAQRVKRVEVLIGQKKYQEAEKICIQILAYQNNHKKSLQLISQIYLSIESYSRAIFFLDTYFEHYSETAITCNNYALAHFYTKDFPTAISYYSKSIALEPENAERYENLGKVFLSLENYGDAAKCYIEAVKIDTKNIEYHTIIADSLSKETQYLEAKKWYEKILEFSPYDKETLRSLEELKKLGF